MKFKTDNRGVSLALTIGLLLLLISITATVNELVIRALRASYQIEASDKAYFAAEGGVENALYELSAHTAGYATDPLGDTNSRKDDLTGGGAWTNEWEISNEDLNKCDNSLASWVVPFIPTYCGRIYGGEKLVFNLFTDDAYAGDVPTSGIGEVGADIKKLSISSISVKFRLPVSVFNSNPNAFNSGLLIDNDGDLGVSNESGPEAILGLNEDGSEDFGYPPNTCYYSGIVKIDDNDCDTVEDEDSKEDLVILWKLSDDSGNSFQPLRGCKGDDQHDSHFGHENAMLCEKSFRLTNDELWVSISQDDKGRNQDGEIRTLQDFLGFYTGGTLQMEFLIVSPMEVVSSTGDNPKISIPYLEYGMTYNAGDDEIPSTYFSIKSDGYYQDFKQSITTNVVPRATTRLLDLTIIQQ